MFASLFVAIEKKVTSVNGDLIRTGQKEFALNPFELETLANLVQALTAATEKIPAVVATGAAVPPLRVSAPATVLVVEKLASHWPYASRLPGLDLLRCMCAAESVAKYRGGRQGDSIVDLVIASATTGSSSADTKLVENSIMMALRAVVNLFATEPGRLVAAQHADKVVALMECVLGLSGKPVGDVQGPAGADNRNVLIALTSAAINFGVLAHEGASVSGKDGLVSDEALTLLLNVLGRVLTSQTDAEVVFRALVGLANIITVPGDGAYGQVAKALGASDWVKTVQSKASEDRVRGLAAAVVRQLG